MEFSTLFKILLIVIFFVGMILYATGRLSYAIDGFHNHDNDNNNCPDLLIQNGEMFYLYNSKAPTVKGSNPKVFTKLSDYAEFVSQNPSCPVLFLQKGSDTQGNDIYKIRGGTPMNPSNYNGLDQIPPLANGEKIINIKPIGNVRVSPLNDNPIMLNPPYNNYNTNGYSPFDPHGYEVGRFNSQDLIHISGELLPVSPYANDANWGGVDYTEEQVNSGKYIGNEVYRPIFSNTTRVINA
jgi:hypothetical protein